jgi:hypothetical protein
VKTESPVARAFYVEALTELAESGIPFLVGGAFAFEHYTQIERYTKDIDIFLRKQDLERTLEFYRARGFHAEILFSHWLAKVYAEHYFIDLIFSSGNGVVVVDEVWFEHAVETNILGVPVKLCPAEESIWSKAFIQERERFDGADVAHLLHRLGPTLDWRRLLARFGPHWRVLLAHIILFGFVYPDRRDSVPGWVTAELVARLIAERNDPSDFVCNGTLLSREQYLFDITRLGYTDPRVEPRGALTRDEINEWTAAIEDR